MKFRPSSPLNETFYIQWHLTNSCNLRCRHCYQEDFSQAKDLRWPGLKRVADHIIATLGEWGRKASIHLTGGEPLLKTELFPLLKDLDRRDEVQELGIITNGLSLDGEVADRLSAFAKLKKIKVSLDGGDAETNDSIRTQGTFEKVLQNLPFLGERKRFEVFLMFTVMRRNFRSILPFIHLGQELGVDGLIFERFIPWGRGRGILGEVLDKDLWRRLVGTLFQFFSLELREGEAFPYQAFQVQFRGDDSELLGAPCVLGKDGICVMPDGTVFPCRRFPLPIGNLLDTSLRMHGLPQLGLRSNRRLSGRGSELLVSSSSPNFSVR